MAMPSTWWNIGEWVASISAPRRHHADGGLLPLHDVDLHGGSLGTQQDAAVLRKIESIRPLAGGVVRLLVKLVEVVLGQLDLAVLHDLKAHADKDLLKAVQHLIHRMLHTDLLLLAGDRHIDGLGGQLQLKSLLAQTLFLLFQRLLHGGADLVGQLSHGGALLRAQLAHLLQHGGELALLSEILHPQGVQRLGGVRSGDGCEGSLPQLL